LIVYCLLNTMGNLFGKKKVVVSRVTEQDRVVLKMKQQRDKLKMYRRQLESRLITEREIARKLVKEGKKDRALMILKKKKYMERMIEKTENHLETIERLTMDVEWAQVEVNVVENLEKGNEALKSLNAMLNIEDIERIMDETKEAADKQNEINQILNGVTDVEFDDDALLDELKEIVGEKVAEPSAKGDETIPSLPDVPMAVPKKTEKPQKTQQTPEMVLA